MKEYFDKISEIENQFLQSKMEYISMQKSRLEDIKNIAKNLLPNIGICFLYLDRNNVRFGILRNFRFGSVDSITFNTDAFLMKFIDPIPYHYNKKDTMHRFRSSQIPDSHNNFPIFRGEDADRLTKLEDDCYNLPKHILSFDLNENFEGFVLSIWFSFLTRTNMEAKNFQGKKISEGVCELSFEYNGLQYRARITNKYNMKVFKILDKNIEIFDDYGHKFFAADNSFFTKFFL